MTRLAGASIGLALILMGSMGCTHTPLKYVSPEPIPQSPAPVDADWIETEATGFLWANCIELNDDAIDTLRLALDPAKLQRLEWFNHRLEQWQDSPVCRTEYGWLSGLVYSAWWPEATKVTVRGLGQPESPSSGQTEFGRDQPSEAQRRAAQAHRIVYSQGLVGLGLAYESNLVANARLAVDANGFPGAPYPGYQDGGSGGLFGLYLVDFGQYTRLGAGLGVLHKRHVYWEDDAETKTVWTENSVAAMLNIGHERTWPHGLIVGWDWATIYLPIYLLNRSGDVHPAENAQIRTQQPKLRIFSLKFGYGF